MIETQRTALLADLRRNLPYYRQSLAPCPLDCARKVRIEADMSGITHDMLVRLIYDRVRDPDTRLYLKQLPMDSDELEPVYDAMLAGLDFMLQWRYGCEYTRHLGTLEAKVPDDMPDDAIPGYIDDLEHFMKEALKLIGADTTCTSSLLKK